MCQSIEKEEIININNIPSIKLSSGYIAIFLTIVISVLITGCMVAHPYVSPEGDIVGGDKKLNEILKLIKKLRDTNALREFNVKYAWYSASIYPAAASVIYTDILPESDKAIEAEYTFLYSAQHLEKAEYCVVNEVLLYNKDETKVICRIGMFFWDGKTWIEGEPARVKMEKHDEMKN